MRRKLCYILPSYSSQEASHFFHSIHLLTVLNEQLDIYLIIEKGSGRPPVPRSIKTYTLRTYRLGILRMFELAGVLLYVRMKGYKHFFTRISDIAGITASVICRLTGARSYFWRSGLRYQETFSIKDLFARMLFTLDLRACHVFFTGPRSMQRYYADKYHIPPQKIRLLFNDIDTTRFGASRALARSHRLDILFAHSLSQRKGAHLLIPIIHAVLSKRSDVHFTIIGSGPLLSKLRSDLQMYVQRGNVTICGAVPNQELPRYYRKASIYIMPSLEEGFPRVLLEAMAAGLPFVATNVGGVLDIIPREQKDLIVIPRDSIAFSQKLLTLIKNTKLRRSLADINAGYVKRFDTRRVSKMYIARIFDEPNVSTIVLDQAATREYLDDLMFIDAYVRSSMGDNYSHEQWQAAHFLKSLPGKWTHSRGLIDGQGNLIGFCICSQKDQRTIHINRFAIVPEYQRQHVGKILLQAVQRSAIRQKKQAVTLSVRTSNRPAISFYKHTGFVIMHGDAVQRFMKATRRPGSIEHGSIIVQHGRSYYLLRKELGESRGNIK